VLTHGSNPNQVALTFDDGPSEWTMPLLDVLAKHDARATFFLLGNKQVVGDRVGTAMLYRDHEAGNHSYSHLCLGDCNEATVREEILRGQEAMGGPPGLFRPPYGRVAPTPVDKIAESMGYKVVSWYGRPAGDWAATSVSEIVDHVSNALLAAHAEGVSPIILLHDGGPKGGEDRHYTVEAVDQILGLFSDRQFVTVSGLET